MEILAAVLVTLMVCSAMQSLKDMIGDLKDRVMDLEGRVVYRRDRGRSWRSL